MAGNHKSTLEPAQARESIWENQLILLGKRLTDTFKWRRSIDESAKWNSAGLFDDAPVIGLSGYSVGSNLASEYRTSESPLPLQPLFVDAEMDVMSFLFAKPSDPASAELIASLTYSSTIQPPLKVDKTIYDAVEFMGLFDPIPMEFTVTFHPDFFCNINENYDEKVCDKKAVEDLTDRFEDQYLPEVVKTAMESFYWTSDAAEEFYANSSYSLPSDERTPFEADRRRALRWKQLSTLLMEKPQNLEECDFSGVVSRADISEGKIRIPVSSFEPEPAAQLSSSAVEMEELKTACAVALVAVFSLEPSVSFISLRATPQIFNFRARSIQQSATVGSDKTAQPYSAVGLLGDGEIGAVADTGADRSSCYFIDEKRGSIAPSTLDQPKYDLSFRKIIQYVYNPVGGDTSDQERGHGSHVAGTVAGSIDGADLYSDGEYDGVAPNAKLSIMDLAITGGIAVPGPDKLYGPGYKAGARVHSNSWGSYFGRPVDYYSGYSEDKYLFTTMDMAVFFAAGNSGPDEETITVQAAGKSPIAVGSSESTLGNQNIDYIAWYSSRGPTYDNRIKPDMVAPGDGLLSVSSNGDKGKSCAVTGKTGTSMASPAAAGAALLVRQYFVDKTGTFWSANCRSKYRSCKPFSPSGVLVKAVLLSSTEPMSMYHGGGSNDLPLGPPPDNEQGFGRANLLNVLKVKGVSPNFDLFVDDLVKIGEKSSVNYRVRVKSSSVPLRIMLCWYDYPAVDGTKQKALINDLDLVVTSPSGKTYYANGRNGLDTVNTNEKVEVSKPQTGTWKVNVESQALPSTGYQDFAIVISGNTVVAYA